MGDILPVIRVDSVSRPGSARGGEALYLLADESGGLLTEGMLPFVVDPVQVTGELEERGQLSVMHVSVAGIHRL